MELGGGSLVDGVGFLQYGRQPPTWSHVCRAFGVPTPARLETLLAARARSQPLIPMSTLSEAARALAREAAVGVGSELAARQCAASWWLRRGAFSRHVWAELSEALALATLAPRVPSGFGSRPLDQLIYTSFVIRTPCLGVQEQTCAGVVGVADGSLAAAGGPGRSHRG